MNQSPTFQQVNHGVSYEPIPTVDFRLNVMNVMKGRRGKNGISCPNVVHSSYRSGSAFIKVSHAGIRNGVQQHAQDPLPMDARVLPCGRKLYLYYDM